MAIARCLRARHGEHRSLPGARQEMRHTAARIGKACPGLAVATVSAVEGIDAGAAPMLLRSSCMERKAAGLIWVWLPAGEPRNRCQAVRGGARLGANSWYGGASPASRHNRSQRPHDRAQRPGEPGPLVLSLRTCARLPRDANPQHGDWKGAACVSVTCTSRAARPGRLCCVPAVLSPGREGGPQGRV